MMYRNSWICRVPPYSCKRGTEIPLFFWLKPTGPTTTVDRLGSNANKIVLRDCNPFPAWADGGVPGADAFARRRMLDRAARRTNAPAFLSALVRAFPRAAWTFGRSKNQSRVWKDNSICYNQAPVLFDCLIVVSCLRRKVSNVDLNFVHLADERCVIAIAQAHHRFDKQFPKS